MSIVVKMNTSSYHGDLFDGLDQEAISGLAKEPKLTISLVQRKLRVGFKRAAAIFRAVRGYKEHIISGRTYAEFDLTPARINWWAKGRAFIFDLGEHDENSHDLARKIYTSQPINYQNYINLYTLTPGKEERLGRYFIMAKNTGPEKHLFTEQMLNLARKYTNGRLLMLDGFDGTITRYDLSSRTPLGTLDTENLYKAMGVPLSQLVLTDLPHGAARMFYAAFLFGEKRNRAAEEADRIIKNYKTAFDGYEKVENRAQMNKYYNPDRNAYEFFNDTCLCFNFKSKNVNIYASKGLKAKELMARNIEAKGLVVSRLDCNYCSSPYIVTNKGITCSELNVDVIKSFDRL